MTTHTQFYKFLTEGPLYLHQFDSLLGKVNTPFVRFADDFLLFAKTPDQAEQAKVYAEKQLARLGLELHPDKTQIVRSGPHVSFFGEKRSKSPR